jgi:hypothetical protein
MKTKLHTTEWILTTNQNGRADPPDPDEVEASMRNDHDKYTEFADRMIRAVHGKSIYSSKAADTDFEVLVTPSQEAFTLLLYRNGYKNWVWVHNTSAMMSSSQESEADQRPPYLYTTRNRDLTSRNGGWSRDGNDKYVQLYDKVKEDRLANNGAFKREYMQHWIEKKRSARKRRRNDTSQPHPVGEDRDDVDILLTALMHGHGQSVTAAGAAPAIDGTSTI